MHTVIDKGPKDPGPAPTLENGETSSPELDAWKAAKRDHDAWHKAHGEAPEPILHRMHDQDAAHAVAADPERYELVPRTSAELRATMRSRMTLDARVAALEAAYDDLVAEDDDEMDDEPHQPDLDVVQPQPQGIRAEK